jgi:acetoin utilization deacetylase AcuC-like enzyme
MIVWSHDRWSIPLPDGHRFPISKYSLLRQRVEADGVVVRESDAVAWEWLAAVHEDELLERIRGGTLSLREQRGLGLPWSAALVERSRRSVGGTYGAALQALERGIGMNLGGGTHHAGRDYARGYCLFNDVAVTAARLRAEGLARRVLVVDCDVHQGDGTAHILGPDPDAFTLSLHGARNYPFERIPSDLDVDLPSGTRDAAYLAALSDALDAAIPAARADLAFFLAGADPWEGDRLGRLSLTKAGLRARDEHVLSRLIETGAAVVVVLAGGYAPDVNDTVDINAGTVEVVRALS